MTMNDSRMTDMELDEMLARVPQPALPEDFAARLQAKLEASAASNVVAFPARNQNKPTPRRYWISAIPLAASLAIGIYLGAAGTVPESFSGLGGTVLSDASDTVLGVGIEDTESFLNGDLS